ncbi:MULTISPECIES: flagellar basal body rod protein FlgC [Leptospirillum]|jgi:flagellar basal-body rod protein FlgC|uniref:Flagellar basal-body rod protein FlgC n=3 Tax=Leptospirillum ferriphilum TaxID=178606 RepID=A0A059XXI5_9BACT|nr:MULTISPECIES: flagellar basal body rod protein FlgC [Leptospirillum]EAY57821.1 MAG: Flagellar basal-body rod protein FlgC [Leptospirillum rubarum]EIJ76041.1 MAG: Flagellar basal-body rod protein FlgC [Leptospirillum sp. Group II 'C75']AFS52470.1 putative flagellar basal-body rod protein FlgC [Leptospirillum ferriphilum ML-04]AIA29942.1 flagellar basal body rod protein FlgC [Leptospirillum ferriphilum YSK]AKS22654.1 flagellar basalbody rod protein [Leptospirillum sp. Group II 'CF-1']
MGFSDAMRIAAGGMEAERVRMNVLAGNLANSQSVHGNPRGVFERRDVIFAAVRPGHSFFDVLRSPRESPVKEVRVMGMVRDPRPLNRVYDPGSPDADRSGYVLRPNVSKLEEMVNLLDASRAYESNLTALDDTKQMARKDLTIHV